jgi:hypothetical protein
MAFRGIFDGSVQIGQAREARAHEAALQQQRIAAQMAMQTQQLQAQANAQRAQLQAQANAQRAQLQAGTQQANADRELKQQQFDSGAALRETQQTNAKILLQQAQADFDEDQARRATLTQFRQSAFGAGLITAALNGVAPTATISRINQANGVADGDLGSVIGMGGGPEGLWYDVIAADEQGKMGKKRQEVDPMTLLAVAHSLYGEKGASEFIQMYKSKDTNNTRMNIAFDKYLQSLEVQKLKNQGAKEVADIKSDTTLAVEDKRTDRATKVQELKNQVGGVLGISAAKVNLPSAVKTLAEQLDNLDAEIRGAEKRKQPLDPKKVKLREDVQRALDNVLGMLGDDGAETAGTATSATKDGGDLTSKIEELNAKGEFDTKLDPGEEAEFKAWKQKYAPKDSGMDYDLRGAFKAGEKPGADGHWTDKFKKPNHPTFSDQSQYAQGEFKRLAGTWKGDKFVPSAEKAGGSAPEAKNLAASQALRRQNATKSTPAKAQAQPKEKDVRSKFFPPVRRSDETLGDFYQKYEQWVNDNPWYRALHEAITPRTKESSLLPPVRKANETPGAHNLRYQRWLKDNPLMRFFEGLKSEPGSKPGEK